MNPASGPWFSSPRERRLWMWTLAVVVAIYATLGLARSLADALAGHDALMVGLFIAGCLLTLAAVITQGLTVRPRGGEVAVALGVASAYLLVFVRMSIPTERSHLVEYGVVAVLILEALLERRRQGRRVIAPGLVSVGGASVVGVLDEMLQLAIPGRVFDPLDILFNLLAAAMAVVAASALGWARRRARSAPNPAE